METGEITLSEKDLKVRTVKKGEITTGGTQPIDLVEAHLIKDGRERKAGDYIIKHEYHQGDIEEQLALYTACKNARLPVPPTFKKGVDAKGKPVLIITNMRPENGKVWTLNDQKERPFPEYKTKDDEIEEQFRQTAVQAAKNGIELTEYSYMAVVDGERKVSIVIADFGHTEIKVHQEKSKTSLSELRAKNLRNVKNFLRRAGIIEDTKPQSKPISVEL